MMAVLWIGSAVILSLTFWGGFLLCAMLTAGAAEDSQEDHRP